MHSSGVIVHKYHHESYSTKNLESFGYIFIADSMDLASASMTWLAVKPNTFSGKHHKMAIAIQGHSRSLILVTIERLYATSY